MIEWTRIRPGSVVVDVQAADGYLSDGIYERLGGQVTCICLEPSSSHRSRVRDTHRSVGDELNDWRSISSDSCDVVIGLAGLHHSPDLDATLSEAYRALRAGGTFAVADVEAGSAEQEFLDRYVHRFSRAGHYANFLVAASVTDEMKRLGFADIRVARRDVSWTFERKEDVGAVFRCLFGLVPEAEEVGLEVERRLGIEPTEGRFRVPWQLTFIRAEKV